MPPAIWRRCRTSRIGRRCSNCSARRRVPRTASSSPDTREIFSPAAIFRNRMAAGRRSRAAKCSTHCRMRTTRLWDWPAATQIQASGQLRPADRVRSWDGSPTARRKQAADAFERWDLQERQAKFICNSVRVYESFGYRVAAAAVRPRADGFLGADPDRAAAWQAALLRIRAPTPGAAGDAAQSGPWRRRRRADPGDRSCRIAPTRETGAARAAPMALAQRANGYRPLAWLELIDARRIPTHVHGQGADALVHGAALSRPCCQADRGVAAGVT